MSLNAQEDALLDLLFSRDRREHWLRDPAGMLADYDLTDAERADFAAIRPDGLLLDARVRLDLMLSQLCRQFPMSFSLLSSRPEGLDWLAELIDADWVRSAPADRPAAFGMRLRDALPEDAFPPAEQETFLQVLEAELVLCWTSGQLRGALREGYHPYPAAKAADRDDAPLRLPAFTAQARLPRPLAELKAGLCPCGGAELWRQLKQAPLPAATRTALLAPSLPRLLVVRAVVALSSACDPEIDHRSAELPDGFAELFEHLDGFTSLTELLQGLAAAGAPATLLATVRTGFHQLLDARLLETAG